MRIRGIVCAAVLSLLSVTALTSRANAQQALTYEQVKTAMDAAEAEARANGWNLTIIIADAQGVPLYLRRMPNAMPRSYDIAMGKIRTVIETGMSTAEYASAVSSGQRQAIEGGVTFDGGFPLRIDGQIVGAMAASGARAVDDAQAVRAGMAAIGIQP